MQSQHIMTLKFYRDVQILTHKFNLSFNIESFLGNLGRTDLQLLGLSLNLIVVARLS